VTGFLNKDGKAVLLNMVKAVQDNKVYLGEIDGLIGDGDHGMNMNKGFTVFKDRYADTEFSFSEGLDKLGEILLTEIGGSMGPIYGTIFMEMASTCESLDLITLADLADIVQAGLDGLGDIIEAKPGDKTLVDTLSPAAASLKNDSEAQVEYRTALNNMKLAAEKGKASTKDMIAKYGRSSRLGERSRGVLDAGATSCCILLQAMADGISEILK
jgi:dihydroxyacetone kinase-like protein